MYDLLKEHSWKTDPNPTDPFIALIIILVMIYAVLLAMLNA